MGVKRMHDFGSEQGEAQRVERTLVCKALSDIPSGRPWALRDPWKGQDSNRDLLFSVPVPFEK